MTTSYSGDAFYSKYLEHHGILGMKWGVRRYQNKDGSLTPEGIIHLGRKNLQKSRTANLDKWGSDAKNNIMYIAGYSGSGKSTTALSLAKPGDKVIHLDAYSESDSTGAATMRNSDFNSYLDHYAPNWKRVANATSTGENGSMKRHSLEYWKAVDQFQKAIETYGEDQFSKNHRVIVEGVQIADDWLTDNKSYYSDKPTVILGTNPVVSLQRAIERDERGNLITALGTFQQAKNYVQWYCNTNKRLNELASTTNAKRAEKVVTKYYS